MAKLFNNIRKKLVAEKPSTTRTANYLKYAIGEIVLVVIGILIALSINNWNETQKNIQTEKSILKNFNSEFIDNKKFIINDISRTKKSIESGMQLMRLMGADLRLLKSNNTDSLIYAVFEYGNFSATENTILEIIQTGKLQYLRNPKLKKLIIEWTQLKIKTLKNQESCYIKSESLVNYLYKRYPVKNIDVFGILKWKEKSKLKVNKYLIFNNIEFEGIIDALLYNYTNYQKSLISMQTLINKIVIETQQN